MTDEGKLNAEVHAGAQAERLMRDPVLTGAFEVLERLYMEQWAASPVRDTEARERIYAHLQALRSVRGHIATIADTGKLARRQLDDLQGRKSFFRR